MYLFIATDQSRLANNEWFVGATCCNISRVKEDLKLDPKTATLDSVLETSDATAIFKRFKGTIEILEERNIGSTKSVLVKGDHAGLARKICQVTGTYEQECPSLRRSIGRWLTNISS